MRSLSWFRCAGALSVGRCLRVNGDGAVIQCVQVSRFMRRAQR